MVRYSFRLPNSDHLGFGTISEAISETAGKAEALGFDACCQRPRNRRRFHAQRPVAQRIRPAHGSLSSRAGIGLWVRPLRVRRSSTCCSWLC